MIKVASNKQFDRMNQQLHQIYQNYEIDPIELINRLFKDETKYKQITPLISNRKCLINFDFMSEFEKSINFVEKCFIEVSEDNKYVDTRIWDKDEIIYDISEFKNGKPNKQSGHMTQKDIVMKAFSKRNFRYMCIKSELLIYLLFVLISKISNDESIVINQLDILIGGMNYVISKCLSMDDRMNINSMARYIWELSTLFNSLSTPDKEINKYLPEHNLFSYDRTLLYENIFGDDLIQTEDDEIIEVIDEYMKNFDSVIEEVEAIIQSSRISISRLITVLSNITKTESKYEVDSRSIIID